MYVTAFAIFSYFLSAAGSFASWKWILEGIDGKRLTVGEIIAGAFVAAVPVVNVSVMLAFVVTSFLKAAGYGPIDQEKETE